MTGCRLDGAMAGLQSADHGWKVSERLSVNSFTSMIHEPKSAIDPNLLSKWTSTQPPSWYHPSRADQRAKQHPTVDERGKNALSKGDGNVDRVFDDYGVRRARDGKLIQREKNCPTPVASRFLG